MNEYDSKKMAEILKGSHNLKLTDKPELADVLLMNTCSVRDKARAKVLSKLGEWRKIKSKSKAIIGLGGCVASMDGAEIKQKMPFVDIVFGPQTLHRLPTLIETAKKDKKLAIDLSFPAIEKFDNLPKPESNGPTAYISIMEGCSKYCKFCIVPYTRGEEVSRGFESILIEALQLAEQGVSEITLLGQNVNAYKSLMPNGKQADLGTLINYIAEIDKIKRIRFTTSHPKEFHQGLIEAYASTHKLVNHLHLPVQSGSNRVLNHMGRGYTAQDFLKKLDALKMIRPDITITSDFIVGYPGESEAEFEETLNLVDTVKFDQSFSFIYSPRPGTPAAFLPDKTPMEEKKSRLHRLQSRLKKYADEYSLNMVGKNFPILVTGSDKKNKGLAGRTENNRVVNFLSKDKSLIGKIINVNVTEKLENSLIGEIT